MKKLSYRSLLFALALAALVLLLPGCDGSGVTRQVYAEAFPSGDVLSISVITRTNPGNNAAYGGNEFETGLSLQTLQKRLSRSDCACTTIQHPQVSSPALLLRAPRPDGRSDVYLLAQKETGRYVFSPLRFNCYREKTADGEPAGESDDLLLPGFYLAPERWLRMDPTLFCDEPYPCSQILLDGAACEDVVAAFEAFYQASFGYTVQREQNTIRLTRTDAPAASFLLEFTFPAGIPTLTVRKA